MTPGFPGAGHSRFRADARRGATRCRITKDMPRRLSRRLIRAALPPIEAAMSEIVQVSLRGTRKEFFLNSRNLWLRLRDKVIVQAEHGESLGSVFLKDPQLIELKRPGNVTREIIRKAEEEDLDLDDHNRQREGEAFAYCRERIEFRELAMDLSEVEVSFSGHRITFYFSAEHRVDFRELVKDLAARALPQVRRLQLREEVEDRGQRGRFRHVRRRRGRGRPWRRCGSRGRCAARRPNARGRAPGRHAIDGFSPRRPPFRYNPPRFSPYPEGWPHRLGGPDGRPRAPPRRPSAPAAL